MKNQEFTARQVLNSRMNMIDDLMMELQNKAQKLAETDKVNWGHAGDAGRMISQLEDMLESFE